MYVDRSDRSSATKVILGCSKCGAALPDEAQFCLKCGKPVILPLKEPVDDGAIPLWNSLAANGASCSGFFSDCS